MIRDILSDVLRSIRVRNASFYHLHLGVEWAVEETAAQQNAWANLARAEHVITYHIMAKGGGWVEIAGEPPVRLAASDIVIFPHGGTHMLSSAPGMRPLRMAKLSALESTNHVVCGFLGCCSRPFAPFLEALPAIIHIPAIEGADWIAQLVRQMLESPLTAHQEGDGILERVGEIVLAEGARCHAEHLTNESVGWLAGLRDRQLGIALGLIHRSPEHTWTIEALARETGLSRSAFHERFEKVLSQSPKQYLTLWRVEIASTLLRETRASIAAIALSVGYQSEVAFARAFKRRMGVPPARWRKSRAPRPM